MIKDGGHVYLECSNCQAVLVDVFCTRLDAINPLTGEPFEWKLKANCPFCGDKAFPVTVKGMFHVGGYGELKEGCDDEDIPSTIIEPPVIEGDCYNFKVLKASPDARPCKRS